MVLKISKYHHIDDIPKILPIVKNSRLYSKNIADIKFESAVVNTNTCKEGNLLFLRPTVMPASI